MSQSHPAAYSRKAWDAAHKAIPADKQDVHPIMATLYAEHRYMGTMVKQLSEQLELLERGEELDAHILFEVMHYMTHFPDAFHHPREDMVYQRAAELDASLADDVDTLQRDHDYLAKLGETALAAVIGWRDGTVKDKAVLKPGREYVAAIYSHMKTEEKLVFPQIEKVLSAEDWRQLEQEDLLTPNADPVFGPRVDREYRNVARKARRALRRGVEDLTLIEWIGLETLLEGVEVLSMAVDNGKSAARKNISAAVEENRDILDRAREERGGLMLVPARCMLNNTGYYLRFLKDCGGIARDTVTDLKQLRQSMREGLRLGLSDTDSEPADPAAAGHSRTLH